MQIYENIQELRMITYLICLSIYRWVFPWLQEMSKIIIHTVFHQNGNIFLKQHIFVKVFLKKFGNFVGALMYECIFSFNKFIKMTSDCVVIITPIWDINKHILSKIEIWKLLQKDRYWHLKIISDGPSTQGDAPVKMMTAALVMMNMSES